MHNQGKQIHYLTVSRDRGLIEADLDLRSVGVRTQGNAGIDLSEQSRREPPAHV